MKRPANLWELHGLAAAYGCRPSAVLGVEDGWAAYQLDMACLVVAGNVAARTAPGENGEPGMTVDEALGIKGEPQEERRHFADPTSLVSGTVRIEDGDVWGAVK